MNLSVRTMQQADIALMVDYFHNSSEAFLKGMGADKSKFPNRADWIKLIEEDWQKKKPDKAFFYMIWELDGQAIGHNNINKITYGKEASMHLHIWQPVKRQKNLGLQLLKLSIPYFFKEFELDYLLCEPYALNVAPNRTLKKLGFEFIQTYETKPGWINFYQAVNQYKLTKEQLSKLQESHNKI